MKNYVRFHGKSCNGMKRFYVKRLELFVLCTYILSSCYKCAGISGFVLVEQVGKDDKPGPDLVHLELSFVFGNKAI